jgi:phosphoglucosamine mutase
VGDRYVLAMLNEVGGTLGGETSGHILCLDKTTTGDGLISALQVLAVMKQTGAGLAELAAGMRKYPQVLLNVRVAKRFDPLQEPTVVHAAQRWNAASMAAAASCCAPPGLSRSFG